MQTIKYKNINKKSSNNNILTFKASNYKIASFLYYIEKNVFRVLDEDGEGIMNIDGILDEIKNIFLKRIDKIISEALIERKKLGFTEVPIESVRELFKQNLIDLFQLFFGSFGRKWDNMPTGAYDKTSFWINRLGLTDFQEKRQGKIPKELNEAYFNSFIEAVIQDIIIPTNGNDRIGKILNKLENNSNQISVDDIKKYTKIIKFFIKKFKIHGDYEEEDLIQEGLESIIKALRKYKGRGFASPETFIRTVVLNRFRDLRREHFALKRGGGDIKTIKMGGYENQIIDAYSLREWELTKEDDELALLEIIIREIRILLKSDQGTNFSILINKLIKKEDYGKAELDLLEPIIEEIKKLLYSQGINKNVLKIDNILDIILELSLKEIYGDTYISPVLMLSFFSIPSIREKSKFSEEKNNNPDTSLIGDDNNYYYSSGNDSDDNFNEEPF